MSLPAAKQGDRITAMDSHLVLPVSGGPPVPVPLRFEGVLDGELSADVLIEGHPAAVKGSTATNAPPHRAPGGTFQTPPGNQGQVQAGSSSVLINSKPAARDGDPAVTCNDPADVPIGIVSASGTVFFG